MPYDPKSVFFDNVPGVYPAKQRLALNYTTDTEVRRASRSRSGGWIGLYNAPVSGTGGYLAWQWAPQTNQRRGTVYFPGNTLPAANEHQFYQFAYVYREGLRGISQQFKFSDNPILPPPPMPKNLLYLSKSYDKSGLTQKYDAADPDTSDNSSITTSYQSVIVEEGTWILYSAKNFNDDDSQGEIQIVWAGETKPLDFQPASLRPLPTTENAVTLFEDKKYGGNMMTITEDVPYLSEFPASTDHGVSSLYISDGSSWKFFLSPQYNGQSFILDPKRDRFYEDSTKFFGQNDSIQSVKKVA